MIWETISTIESPDDQQFILCLYETFYRSMEAVIIAVTSDRQLTTDLIHNAILRLIPHIGKLRSMNEPQRRKYAILTAQCAAIDHMRKVSSERRWRYYAEEYEELASTGYTPEDACIRKEEQKQLRKAVSGLAPRDYDLIQYKYFLELPDEEISHLTGIAHRNLREALSRARKRLRVILMGGDSCGK